MYRRPRLIRDSVGRDKLKVALPGGVFQLSLDDRAVNVLRDDLALDTRDHVPEEYVPFFVAMGDAWFPREKDTQGIIQALRSGQPVKGIEREVLIDYVTQADIPTSTEPYVVQALEKTSLSNDINIDDIHFRELPEIPAWSELTDEMASPDAASTDAEAGPTATVEPPEGIEQILLIPGIGEHRATSFVEAGITSLEEIADARPPELASINGISANLAAVAIEGARATLGQEIPISKRLEEETGEPASTFKPILNSLAAGGIPPTDAADTLRVLYGPTIADIDGLAGHRAYFLWEAGYQTPHDVVAASVEELTDVYQIGGSTASKLQEDAQKLIQAD